MASEQVKVEQLLANGWTEATRYCVDDDGDGTTVVSIGDGRFGSHRITIHRAIADVLDGAPAREAVTGARNVIVTNGSVLGPRLAGSIDAHEVPQDVFKAAKMTLRPCLKYPHERIKNNAAIRTAIANAYNAIRALASTGGER